LFLITTVKHFFFFHDEAPTLKPASERRKIDNEALLGDIA